MGFGRIAQAAHLPAIAKADSAELVAVCDPSPTLAHGMAGRYGVSAFLDAANLLATDVEAVVTAAPAQKPDRGSVGSARVASAERSREHLAAAVVQSSGVLVDQLRCLLLALGAAHRGSVS